MLTNCFGETVSARDKLSGLHTCLIALRRTLAAIERTRFMPNFSEGYMVFFHRSADGAIQGSSPETPCSDSGDPRYCFRGTIGNHKIPFLQGAGRFRAHENRGLARVVGRFQFPRDRPDTHCGGERAERRDCGSDSSREHDGEPSAPSRHIAHVPLPGVDQRAGNKRWIGVHKQQHGAQVFGDPHSALGPARL